MLPDPSVSVGIVMSGKCVAGGSVIVVVSPLISRMEDQCRRFLILRRRLSDLQQSYTANACWKSVLNVGIDTCAEDYPWPYPKINVFFL